MAQVFPLTADESGLDEAQAALVQTLAELPEEWTLLRQRRIGDAGADAVLVHPAVGVALIDLAPNAAGDARAALIAHLERERFFQYFPGELPVVAVSIAVEDLPAIGERLEASFAAAPALGIGDGDWADAVIELLLQPEDVAMTPTSSFAAPPPEPEPPMPQRSAAASSEPLPFTLRAEFPVAYEEVRPRRPGRAAAIAVALLAIIGAGVAAWSLGGDQGGPSAEALREAQVQIPLTPPAATPAPAASAPTAKPVPPPLPASPTVMMAAKPFASPPPAAPKPTSVAALPAKPPVVMAAKTPAPLPPAAPRPTRVAPLPTMAAQAAPPPPGNHRAAKPRPRPEVAASRKPQREARQQPDASQQLMQRQLDNGSPGTEQALAPPVDINDLPRLPPEQSQPSSAPAPSPAIGAPSGSTIGPPVRLVRQPEAPPSASDGGVPVAVSATAGSQRECRPYTSSTTLTGRAVAVQGIACRDGDGQWRLVSEAPQR